MTSKFKLYRFSDYNAQNSSGKLGEDINLHELGKYFEKKGVEVDVVDFHTFDIEKGELFKKKKQKIT